MNNKLRTGTIISLAILGTAVSGFAGLQELSVLRDTHIFFVEVDGQKCPIVGVKSATKVNIRLPNKKEKIVRFKNVVWAEKELPPVARITICEVQGTTMRETYIDENFVSGMSEMVQEFEIVADRFIPDTYVALIFEFPNGGKAIAFGHVGDLPAAKLVDKTVVFPNSEVPPGTRYRFEFFTKGMPIEMYRLERVANSTKSRSLMIPWEVRMKQFLWDSNAKNTTRPPKLFASGFMEFKPSEVKQRGVKQAKLKIRIKKDGVGELVEAGDQLTKDEMARLSKDIANWLFFPALKEGKPIDNTVSVPMNF